jgi:hypothetical protein
MPEIPRAPPLEYPANDAQSRSTAKNAKNARVDDSGIRDYAAEAATRQASFRCCSVVVPLCSGMLFEQRRTRETLIKPRNRS